MVGAKPCFAKTYPIIPDVVVLPCVPETAIRKYSDATADKMSVRWRTSALIPAAATSTTLSG